MKFITEILDHTKYVPIGDKVLFALPREDINDMINIGGILQPKGLAQKNDPMRETNALAVGPDCKQVASGDTCLWNIRNASPFPRGEWDLYFLPESHLVCITKKATRPSAPSDFPFPVAGAPDEGSS